MSQATRRVLVAAFITCIVGAVVGLVQNGELIQSIPRLMFMAACTFAIILWVRPGANADALCRAEVTGYLEGMKDRSNVIRLSEHSTTRRQLYLANQRREG